jgi:molybdopterin synthase sulfur carrier subunit
MQIQLRFFASLREALGPSDKLEVPAPCSVAELRDLLIARGAPFDAALSRGKALRAARNQTLCDETDWLDDGDELAFFPPVTGG